MSPSTPTNTTVTTNNANRSILSSKDDMDKDSLVVSIELLEKIASVGAILVAIGVVIEALIGVALIVKHHKLKTIQHTEEMALIDRIEETKRESANARKETEELRKSNLELEAKIQPRRITPEQRAIIAKELLKWPRDEYRVKVSSEAYDIEARVFVLEIVRVLNEAEVFCIIDNGSINLNKELFFGVKFIEHESSRKCAAITRELGKITSCSTEVNTNLPIGYFGIEVGAKPMQ